MMDGIKDKIKEAQKAGYGDDEIVQFLAQMPTVGTQVNAALENEYKPSEILKFLGESRSKAFEAGAKLGTTTRALASAAGGPSARANFNRNTSRPAVASDVAPRQSSRGTSGD
jgi:hypothetical protein